MRVGFIISGSLDTLTGGYIYDRQLVDHLQREGNQVDVIFLPVHSYFDRLLYGSTLSLSKKLSHLSLDVLLEDELDHPALIFLNRKLQRQANYPIVSIVHNLHSSELRAEWQNRLYRRIERYYLTSVDGFVFNSNITRQSVESLIGTSRAGVVANPCGNRLPVHITETEIRERAKIAGPLRIVFLGNLFRNKSLHVLLDAMAQLPGNDYFLTVIGDLSMDRSYARAIKNQILINNLKDQVSLMGPLNNDALINELKESHILAVPSFYEGYGIAYLEGMGLGLPAIGTTAGGAKEIITHGHNGFLISPGDSALISQYLRELNEDRERLISMSLNACQRFKSHPTWKDSAEKILNFLQSLCSSPSQTN
jgi:glycosyltransferase involved in cell wall biosynthesis